jgi:sulfur relay (sulfurtransferase) DsrF/TusC family protein
MKNLMILIRSGPENTVKLEEALRLAATMLGFDQAPIIIFLDEGVKCLHTNAIQDNMLLDYLQAISDLAQLFMLLPTKHLKSDLNKELEVGSIDLDELMVIINNYSTIVSF